MQVGKYMRENEEARNKKGCHESTLSNADEVMRGLTSAQSYVISIIISINSVTRKWTEALIAITPFNKRWRLFCEWACFALTWQPVWINITICIKLAPIIREYKCEKQKFWSTYVMYIDNVPIYVCTSEIRNGSSTIIITSRELK